MSATTQWDRPDREASGVKAITSAYAIGEAVERKPLCVHVVTRALEEFIARRQRKGLLDLMGKLEWDRGFDYKSERSRN